MNKKLFAIFGLLCVLSLSITAQYVSSFSWSNYLHTPDDQKLADGPCSAFATVVATEGAYRLFFNRNLLADNSVIDFSDQLLYSYCSLPYSDPGNGASIYYSLKFLNEQQGIYKKSLYPYVSAPPYWDTPSNRNPNYDCTKPNGTLIGDAERVKISSYSQLTFNASGSGEYNVASDNDLKRILLKYGPVIVNIQFHPNLHPGHGHSYVLVGWTTKSSGVPEWNLYDSWPASDPSYKGRSIYISNGGTINVNLVQWLCASSSNGHAYVINLRTANAVTSSKSVTVNCPADQDGDGRVYWGLGPKPATCPSGTSDLEDNEFDNNPLEGARDAYGNFTPLPIPASYITVSESTGKIALCPSQTYVIRATTSPSTTVLEYSWVMPSGVTLVSTSGNTATVSTSSTYTTGQIGVKLRNAGGWSVYKYSTFGVINYNTITVGEQNNRTTLCPNTNYVFVANVPGGALQWDWYMRGNVTEVSRTGNTITVRTSSTFSYAVLAAKARNCAGWSDFKYTNNYFVCSGLKNTGTNDQDDPEKTISLYPNPVNQGEPLFITIPAFNGNIKIFDIAGSEKMAKIKTDGNGKIEIATTSLKQGIYFIKASTTKGTVTGKFAVK
jgi:hypothetical protein